MTQGASGARTSVRFTVIEKKVSEKIMTPREADIEAG